MVEPRTAVQAGERVHVVGLFRRVAACLLDGLLLSPMLIFAAWLAFRVTGIPATTGRGLRPEALLDLLVWGGLPFYSIVAVAATIALLYSFLFVTLTGKTPGLRVLRSRVINVYGDRPEWWRSLFRCIALLIGLIPLGLGLLWIGFDREKRGLHDWLAGTYVVRSRPAGG